MNDNVKQPKAFNQLILAYRRQVAYISIDLHMVPRLEPGYATWTGYTLAQKIREVGENYEQMRTSNNK